MPPHNKIISESKKRQNRIQASLTDIERKRLRKATKDASVAEEAGAMTTEEAGAMVAEEITEKVRCAVHTSSAS
jgi:hypothetical protein